MADVRNVALNLVSVILVSGHLILSHSIPAQTQGEVPNGEPDGLDLWLLFGAIGLFLVIVLAITLLRRWR